MKYIVVVMMLIIGTNSAWGDMDFKDKNVWMQLLNSEKYDVLEKELSSLQSTYEKNPSTERNLLLALSAFKNSDPALKNKLEVWVREKKNSIFSHLALAMYHEHLGWLSRGSRWGKDTTSQQFSKMKAHFRKANDELQLVIAKNPKISIAYAVLISVNTLRKQKLKYYNEGIKNNPLSSVIRTTYLNYLLPKWGGSFEEIEAFLAETKPLYKKNPNLAIEEGFLEYAKGDKIFTSGSKTAYEDALKYLNKAIEKSIYGRYLNRRAQVYKYMKNYQKSIDDYTKALELTPHDSNLLAGRGSIYYRLKQYDLALNDTNEALQYDKYNPEALQMRGFIYYVTDEIDKAFIDLTDSLIYGFEKKSTHEYIGYIHYYTKKNYRLAAEALKTSSDLGNKDSHIWYLITASQWHNRDCDFVNSADIYAQRCKKSGECKKKNLDWAVKSANYAKKTTCRQ